MKRRHLPVQRKAPHARIHLRRWPSNNSEAGNAHAPNGCVLLGASPKWWCSFSFPFVTNQKGAPTKKRQTQTINCSSLSSRLTPQMQVSQRQQQLSLLPAVAARQPHAHAAAKWVWVEIKPPPQVLILGPVTSVPFWVIAQL